MALLYSTKAQTGCRGKPTQPELYSHKGPGTGGPFSIEPEPVIRVLTGRPKAQTQPRMNVPSGGLQGCNMLTHRTRHTVHAAWAGGETNVLPSSAAQHSLIQ